VRSLPKYHAVHKLLYDTLEKFTTSSPPSKRSKTRKSKGSKASTSAAKDPEATRTDEIEVEDGREDEEKVMIF